MASFIRSAATSRFLTFFILWVMAGTQAVAVESDSPWQDVIAEARGQTVYFNAWGGSERINQYLQWASERLEQDYGVTLEHVKVADISEIVGQLEAARLVGRNEGGNVDLMWVNGENFAALKFADLLWGAFADNLPNATLVKQSASITADFSVPVEGLESPWGGAQLVFIGDSATTPEPPASAAELHEFVADGGRFAYPAPPAFHGTTFVKQLLIELVSDNEMATAALAAPVEDADFDALTTPLWQYLDKLHPLLRGGGDNWPVSGEMTLQLLDDGELDIAISFNPNEASAAVRNEQLPDTVRTYVFTNGTIGNTHFVTVPWNASAKAGAMVAANFLLSPEAQARKADPEYWGDPTVLDMKAMDESQRALFEAIDRGVWALPLGEGSVLSEPHASWTSALEKAWIERYGQ
ncbi:MAG: ABC transporter substrate-binding protein [Granulosicoccus sp.]